MSEPRLGISARIAFNHPYGRDMELGIPLHPDRYSDDFARLCKAAGVPAIRLHDARHSCLSLLEKSGVLISIVSAWAGHYDAAFTLRTYVHAGTEDLREAGVVLARLYAPDSAQG